MNRGPFQDMDDAWFTQQIWRTVPGYMLEKPRCGAEDEAIAYVIGVRSFPYRVVEALRRLWLG